MKRQLAVSLAQNVEIFKNKELIHRSNNLVVTTGRNYIAERMISAIPDVMTHMAIGTGSGFSADIVANGIMESDSNWSDYGSPTSNTRSALQAHSGTYSREIVASGGTVQGIVSDAFITITDRDLFVQAWIWPTASTSIVVAVLQGDGDRYLYYKRWTGLTAGMWNKIDFSVLETSGGGSGRVYFMTDAADTVYIDDASIYNSVLLSETALNFELSRVVLTSALRTDNYITYIADWVAGIGTGSIEEAGIFNDPAAGTMLSRVAFPVITKLVDDSLSINWRIYIQSV